MAKKDQSEYVKIRVALESMMPDRTNYKQYMIKCNFTNLFIQVDVPAHMVVSHTDEETVLTPAGAVFVANVLASEIDELHNNFLHSN